MRATAGGLVSEFLSGFRAGCRSSDRLLSLSVAVVEFQRQAVRNMPGGPSRYYNGGAAGGPSERHPLVPGSGGLVRPVMAYASQRGGGDPDESRSLLVDR